MTATSRSERLDPRQRGVESEEFYSQLERLVVGQSEALTKVTEIYETARAGLSAPGKPLGSFLFLGPTGTGKTRVTEALAQTLLGDPGAVIKIDCAEFQHSHEIAKLIGSPPGYLGHRETQAALSQQNLNKYWTSAVHVSILLFDEIEKASDSLWNLLLGILDKATLTLGDGTKVDFTHTLIFLTSNLGAKEMSAVTQPSLGFTSAQDIDPAKLTSIGSAAARKKFTPEFINRLDHIITFRTLTREDLGKILNIELDFLYHRIMSAIVSGQIEIRFLINVSTSAKELLLEKGTDPKYGARSLKRTLDREVLQPIVNLLNSDQLRDGCVVVVDTEGGEFVFLRENSK